MNLTASLLNSVAQNTLATILCSMILITLRSSNYDSKQHNFRLDSLPVAIVYVLHIIFGITKLLYFEEQRVSKLLHDSVGGRQLPFSQSKLPLPQCFICFFKKQS